MLNSGGKLPVATRKNECKYTSLCRAPCPTLRSGLRPVRVRCTTLHTQTKGNDSERNRARPSNNIRLFHFFLLLVEAKQ